MSQTNTISLVLNEESDTQALGSWFAKNVDHGVMYLEGDLGAGKTCFSQALIRGAGYEGRVKSPTYTLLEPYELPARNIYHFDLYRLQDEEELLFLGCDDYFESAQQPCSEKANLCLIEWPQKARSILPTEDIALRIAYLEPGRSEAGRKAHINGLSQDHLALLTTEFGIK